MSSWKGHPSLGPVNACSSPASQLIATSSEALSGPTVLYLPLYPSLDYRSTHFPSVSFVTWTSKGWGFLLIQPLQVSSTPELSVC